MRRTRQNSRVRLSLVLCERVRKGTRRVYTYIHVGDYTFLGKVTALGVLCCFALLFV